VCWTGGTASPDSNEKEVPYRSRRGTLIISFYHTKRKNSSESNAVVFPLSFEFPPILGSLPGFVFLTRVLKSYNSWTSPHSLAHTHQMSYIPIYPADSSGPCTCTPRTDWFRAAAFRRTCAGPANHRTTRTGLRVPCASTSRVSFRRRQWVRCRTCCSARWRRC
jgi:hypothetical protein